LPDEHSCQLSCTPRRRIKRLVFTEVVRALLKSVVGKIANWQV